MFHWYVSYEANLNAFAIDIALKNAYAAYLLELSNRLTAIRPGSILWSPAFWTKYASVSNKSALAVAVKNVLDTAPKVNWLHFQDFVGQAAQRSCSSGAVSYGFSSADGIGYHGLIAGSGAQLASLQINMEHFVLGGPSCPAGAIYPGEKTELGGAGATGTDAGADAASGESERDDGACGCRQAPRRSMPSALGGLALLLLAIRALRPRARRCTSNSHRTGSRSSGCSQPPSSSRRSS